MSDTFDLSARVASTTKDSIFVKWQVENPLHQTRDLIQGFQVRYQAIGSTVVQYSHRLDSTTSAYDITQLHENTFYDICIKVFVRVNSSISASAAGASSHASGSPVAASAQEACVKGTTATDSLAVALGSTFGAFLALGFIVFLVFLAKWQHSRRMRKQKLVTSSYDENGVEQLRGCDDSKETFLGSGIRYQDDLAMSELSGQSSEVSIAMYADQMSDNRDNDPRGSAQPSNTVMSSLDDGLVHRESSDSGQDWISATANCAPFDSEGSKWLLRPPPIPGVIIRSQVKEKDAVRIVDQADPGSSVHKANSPAGTSQHPAAEEAHCSYRNPTHDQAKNAADNSCLHNKDDEDESDQTAASHRLTPHRPLKPTASNLW